MTEIFLNKLTARDITAKITELQQDRTEHYSYDGRRSACICVKWKLRKNSRHLLGFDYI